RHLCFDSADLTGIDVGDRAAVLAVVAVAQPVEDLDERRIVHRPSPPSGPPPVAAGPTALRTRTKCILCASIPIEWRTLHTKYFPDANVPAPATATICPTRSTPPRRFTSASPSQRTNQPASPRTAALYASSAPASSAATVNNAVVSRPAKVLRSRSSSGA